MASFSHITRTARNIISGALDLAYPPHCVVCNCEGEHYFCPKCIEEVDFIERPYCRKCGLPVEPGRFSCQDCREREYAFESACAAAVYEGPLQKAIHSFKYSFHIILADPLGDILSRNFASTYLAGKVDLIVPIPIHRSRMLERGFNQAAELAKRLGGRVHLPVVENVLVKAKATPHQANLPYDKRLVNVKGAFGVRNSNRVTGKRILLIDDVFTTGSTLHEAACALKEAGAGVIYGYTLARSV